MPIPSIQFTEQALKYIEKSNLNHSITIDLEYIEGCPMQCCRPQGKALPRITIANPQNTDVKFIRIDTAEKVPIQISKRFLKRVQNRKELTIDVKGSWKSRRFLVKEIGEGPLREESCQADTPTHKSEAFSKYNYSQLFRS